MNERVKSPTFDFPFDPHRNHSPATICSTRVPRKGAKETRS